MLGRKIQVGERGYPNYVGDWRFATVRGSAETGRFRAKRTCRDAGFGGVFAQAALIQTINPNWAYGLGARLVAPGQDLFASGKWQIMPDGVRYSFLELRTDTYFVPVVRYAISVAGDSNRRNISEPQIAPTLNIGLPDHWQDEKRTELLKLFAEHGLHQPLLGPFFRITHGSDKRSGICE